MGVVIPFVELITGTLVILGLRVREALVALGFVLAVVTFGHLLNEPLYEFHTHVIPRLALLLFIFLLPRRDDRSLFARLRHSETKLRLTSHTNLEANCRRSAIDYAGCAPMRRELSLPSLKMSKVGCWKFENVMR